MLAEVGSKSEVTFLRDRAKRLVGSKFPDISISKQMIKAIK